MKSIFKKNLYLVRKLKQLNELFHNRKQFFIFPVIFDVILNTFCFENKPISYENIENIKINTKQTLLLVNTIVNPLIHASPSKIIVNPL